jgi:hypothetical protein
MGEGAGVVDVMSQVATCVLSGLRSMTLPAATVNPGRLGKGP